MEKNHQCVEMKRTIEQLEDIEKIEVIMREGASTMILTVVVYYSPTTNEAKIIIPSRFCPFCGKELVNVNIKE